MSLYDDEDLDIGSTGWTPGGMKLLQTHVQLKKVAKGAKSKQQARIAPVVDLKSAKDFGFTFPKAAGSSFLKSSRETRGASSALIPGSVSLLYSDMSTPIVDEYDPMKPNDYEKAVKVLRARQEEKRTEVDKNREKDRHDRDTRRKSSEKDRDRDRDRDREREKDRDRDRSRNDKDRDRDRDRRRTREDSPPAGVRIPEGFCKVRGESDDEDDEPIRNDKSKDKSRKDRAGAMIAPPPSLQEKESSGGGGGGPGGGSGSGLAFAAKIMAKYGYKEGQGLGKHEHGISTALQVEKTSRRGGRIIGEKSLMPPPPGALGGSPSAGPSSAMDEIVSLMPPPPPPPLPGSMPPPPPPMLGGFGGGGGFGGSGPVVEEKKEDENSITEIMKHPSKVALLRNMVGPGEVDGELEPEVKDECTTKYGDVLKVIIFEMPERPADEAVRIFVEFRRMESAIKAVVDLNGRFFGGRQVKAGFYDQQRFNSLQLAD